MTRTSRPPAAAARRLLIAAFVAALGLFGAPASGQTPPTDQPCPKSALREACANQPLDAYRQRPQPEPSPPVVTDPLRPAVWRAAPVVGRVGRPYGPVRLITGGAPPYEPETNGLPDSLRVDENGFLRGRPAARDAGLHEFTLTIRDAAGGVITQNYRLRITGAAPAPKPRPRPGPTPPTPAPVKPTPAPLPQAQVADGEMIVYVLRRADMAPPKALPPAPAPVPAPQGAGGAGITPVLAPVPPPPPPPPGEKMAVAAAPPVASYPTNLATQAAALRNIEYTSRDLFEHALQARYLKQVDPKKPRPPPLTPAQVDLVADRAMERRSFAAAPKLNWTPEAGCGCALPLSLQTKEVYGFFPFWRSKTPPPSIVFSDVSRIGFLGVQLGSDGGWIQPSGARFTEAEWWAQTSKFAQAAHAHGARLDLVLQRSDWAFLVGLTASQRQLIAGQAARAAVDLADTRLRNRGASMLLLPFWKEPRYVFDGITVMFDYPEGASPEIRRAYLQFHDDFMDELIRAMQRPKAKKRKAREYALHIVAPDPLAESADDPTNTNPGSASDKTSMWREFLNYKHVAEPPTFHRAAPPRERREFKGSSNIRVRMIVPVREPTSDTKKRLRANIDLLTDVRGYNRVAVQQSILPVIYLPAGDGPIPEPPVGYKIKPTPNMAVKMTRADEAQLDDDLIYYRQNFGGVAFWPAPFENDGIAKYVYADLKRVFYTADSSTLRIVNVKPICSLLLRLLWQALVIVGLFATAAYFIWGQASARAPLYWRGLMVLAVGFVVLSGVLLTFDPALAGISRSNGPLFVLLALALGWGGWRAVKPKIPRP